jgi:putative transposase
MTSRCYFATMKQNEPLLSGNYYHVFSRATGNEVLFKTAENYRSFLDSYKKYIAPLTDCFAFSLLPNHFHFLNRIKEEAILEPFYRKATGKIPVADWQPRFMIKQWSNLLNSYAKSFNKKYNRKGSLFIDAVKRTEIIGESDLCYVAFYIHKNAVHHGYSDKMENWYWCSYNAILSDSPTMLQRDELLEWFGQRSRFISYHEQPIEIRSGFENG